MEKVIEEIQQAIKALTPMTPTTPIGAEQIIDARYCLGKALNEALKISCNPMLSDSLVAFTEWQKKYKDSSYADMFNVAEYLKATNVR